MWLAITLTTILGLVFMAFGIWGVSYYLGEHEFNKPMDIREFRYYKLKQEPDSMGVFGLPHYDYDNKLSKQDEQRYEDYKRKCRRIRKVKNILLISLPIVLFIIALLGFARLGAFLDNEHLKKDVEEYKSAKYTIEQSLTNEQLTGLERIELLKQVRYKNEWLARKKYEVGAWYNFHLDDKIILDLEFIDLKGDKLC